MKSCFMFGHSDCSEDILPDLQDSVEWYYKNLGVGLFYVGNRGRFDSLAATAVKRMKKSYPDICLNLVLAYHPAERAVELPEGFDNSYFPPLEGTPRQYAIAKANQHMVKTAEVLICYVKHFGNSRRLLEYAQRLGKVVDNLAVDGHTRAIRRDLL